MNYESPKATYKPWKFGSKGRVKNYIEASYDSQTVGGSCSESETSDLSSCFLAPEFIVMDGYENRFSQHGHLMKWTTHKFVNSSDDDM